MNISRIVVVLVAVSCLFLGACANNPQLGLRGNPNAPWTNMQYLQIDPNAMMHMSPAQYDEYVRRVNTHNQIVNQQLQNDRMAAQNAQTWTGNVNQDRYYSIDRTLGRGFDNALNRWINSIDFN